MTPRLLLDGPALATRRAAAAADATLTALAASLARDLDAVLAADVHVAERKARLTRAGGRCPADGSDLAFDPFSPHAHRCPRCDRVASAPEHHEAWLYRYQLWLTERAVHAAALHALRPAPRLAAFAARVLDEAADRYLAFPNRDNVLGPSRPFFSTYLESLWLLSLCTALDLLEAAEPAAHAPLGARVRERVLEPSRALVAGFPEGRSNRQVWNAAALLAAARLLGDDAGAERAVHGPAGLVASLRDGVLTDGTWYEGENYHQFAHRGLWYGLRIAERAGIELDPTLAARFDAGFAAPFAVVLPDLTLPARRDSRYAVSLRQWRWAEWCELGVERAGAHAPVGALCAGVLERLYDPSVPTADTGRWRASGESERNEPPTGLTPADLGWKSLLLARSHSAPPSSGATPWRPASVLLGGQGLAILRDAERGVYAALDYGASGGPHGHADRLNVILQRGGERWLDDPGTGSYVERELHWYRSTLAHAAPLVGERSQPRADGRLLGWSVGGGAFSGVAAEAAIGAGAVGTRTLVLGSGYLVDRVTWTAAAGDPLDLPLPVDVRAVRDPAGAEGSAAWRPVLRPGGGGLEDGFDFLTDVEATPLPAGTARLHVVTRDGGAHATLWIYSSLPAELWRARAPGAPGQGVQPWHALRVRAPSGTVVAVWDLGAAVRAADPRPDGSIAIDHADGRDLHRPPSEQEGDWTVEQDASSVASVQRLALARVDASSADVAATSAVATPTRELLTLRELPVELELGEHHYRPSEASWGEAGAPSARVRLHAAGGELHVEVRVRLGRAPHFAPAGADNPLDNERADVNSDGLQLHLGLAADGGAEPLAAWLLVPEPPGPRVRLSDCLSHGIAPVGCEWSPETDGWRMRCALPLAPVAARAAARSGAIVTLDVLVNEMPGGRERRRGQLVLSGAAGDFVYLRGDRHDPARGLRLALDLAADLAPA